MVYSSEDVDMMLRKAYFEDKDYEKVRDLLNTYEIMETTREAILHDAISMKIWPVVEFWEDFELPESTNKTLTVIDASPVNPTIYDVMKISKIFNGFVQEIFYFDAYATMLHKVELDIWQLDAVAFYAETDFYSKTSQMKTDFYSNFAQWFELLNYKLNYKLNVYTIIKKYGFNYLVFLMDVGIITEPEVLDIIVKDSEYVDDVFINYLFDMLKNRFGFEFMNKLLTYFIEQRGTDLYILNKLVNMGATSAVAPDFEEYSATTDDEEVLEAIRNVKVM